MGPDRKANTTKAEELIARGFWGPRKETPGAIADRLVTFLTALNEVIGGDLLWESHELPGKPLTDLENARQVISDAFRKNTDAPHLGIVQAYDSRSASLNNISLSMVVGGHSDSPKIKNTFVVKWHRENAEEFAEPILRQIVSVWDPDWASVTSQNLMRSLVEIQPVGTRIPALGYLTYLSENRAKSLPDGLGKLSGGGVILGLDEDGFLIAEKLAERAKVLGHSAAFLPTPTTRSKL